MSKHRYLLTITAAHLRAPRSMGQHWRAIVNCMGHLLPSDVGKRCFMIGDVVQCENDQQRDARKAVPRLFILRRDVTLADCWPNQGGLKWPATFPKGTPVQRVGAKWAIRDKKTIAAITGNAHDAHHRYVWVEEEDCPLPRSRPHHRNARALGGISYAQPRPDHSLPPRDRR